MIVSVEFAPQIFDLWLKVTEYFYEDKAMISYLFCAKDPREIALQMLSELMNLKPTGFLMISEGIEVNALEFTEY